MYSAAARCAFAAWQFHGAVVSPAAARGAIFARAVHRDTRHKFADKIRVQAIGGAGGKGIISFESIDNIKKRPIGGHGGRGGDVVVVASATVRDLSMPSYVVRGRDGGAATGKGNNGKAGKPRRLMVPVGTVVWEVQRVFDFGGDDASFGSSGIVRPADERDAEEAVAAARDDASEGQEGATADAVEVVEAREWGDSEADGGWELVDGDASSDGEGEDGSGTRVDELGQVWRTNKAGIPYREVTTRLADLDAAGQALLVAAGGAPGVGNRGSLLNYADQVRSSTKPHILGALCGPWEWEGGGKR